MWWRGVWVTARRGAEEHNGGRVANVYLPPLHLQLQLCPPHILTRHHQHHQHPWRYPWLIKAIWNFLFHYSQHIGPQHLFESGNLFQGSKCSQRLYLIICIEWYIIVHYIDNKNQSCGGTKCLVMSSNEGLEVRSHLFLSGLLAAINTSHFSLHCHVFTALTNTPGPLDTCQRSQNISIECNNNLFDTVNFIWTVRHTMYEFYNNIEMLVATFSSRR